MNVSEPVVAGEAATPRESGRRTSDARLVRAFELVADPSVSVLSLDVFDTMLWRRVADPVDAFLLLAERLTERGILARHIGPAAFMKIRVMAEARARGALNASGRGVEVSLDEIYQQFGIAPPEQLAEVEVEVERELLAPDLDILELVRFAHEHSKQVVAVSDTYFSEGDLRSFLDPHFTLQTAVDRVFASNEHREGKTSGLFDIVLRELGVDAQAVVHVGDNELADIDGARRSGIRAFHFERRPDELDRIVKRERNYLDTERVRPGGDHGLTALRGKALQRRELDELPEQLRPFWRYGAVALGPTLTGFATWVQQTTRRRGAETAYCLMREGALLSQLVRSAGAQVETPVRAEPLWLSRQVCARASIFEGRVDELETLLKRRRPPTVRELAETLRVEAAASQLLASNADARLDEAALAREVLEEITTNPELRGPLVSEARLLRERVLEYVRARVPGGAGELVLVDLGWGGSIQKLLQEILRREDVPIHTTGLYLVTHDLAVERVLDGLEIHSYIAHCGVPAAATRSIMRTPEVVEQICMPDVGSQIDLTAELEPVLSDPIDSALEQSAERGAVQSGIFAFQREWSRYADLDAGRARLSEDDARELLLAQFLRATIAPTSGEAAAFGRWIHDENYGSTGTEEIVGGPRTTRALRYMDAEALIGLPMSDLYWPYGLAALEDEHFAEAVDAVTTERISQEALGAALETGDVEIFYDNGFGYGEGWKVRLDGRRNRFGLSYARAEVKADEVRGVRFDPAKAPCLVRVDWIAVRCHVRGNPDPVELRFDTPEAFARLTLRDLTPIAPKLWMTGDDPNFEVDLHSLVGPHVYKAVIEAAFAILAVTPPREDPRKVAHERRKEEGRRAAIRLVRRIENRTGLSAEPWRRRLRRAASRLRS